MTHTPGPWAVLGPIDNGGSVVVDEQDVTICRTYQQPHDDWQAKDNANLIAAAPELLNALEDVLRTYVKWYSEVYPDHAPPKTQPILENANRVVNKAKGE